MDKNKLFYIVERGTNNRILNADGKPKIIDVTMEDDEVRRHGWLNFFGETIRISIEDYESKFGRY